VVSDAGLQTQLSCGGIGVRSLFGFTKFGKSPRGPPIFIKIADKFD